MTSDEINSILKAINDITFSKHFEEKARLRGISKEVIQKRIRDLSGLIEVEDQGHGQLGQKFGLLFKLMSNYDLKVVVSIKQKSLNVVTSYIQNVRKRKAYRKWLEGQR